MHKLALASVLTLMAVANARAADITETYNFTLGGFIDGGGSVPPPISTISGSFTLTFDPTAASTGGGAVTTNAFSAPVFGPPFYSAVAVNPTVLEIGTLASSPGNVVYGSSDFALNLILANPNTPTFLLCGQYGSNCGNATGYASGYTLDGHPNDVWVPTTGAVSSTASSPPFVGKTVYELPAATASVLAATGDTETSNCCASQASAPPSGLPVTVTSKTPTKLEFASATASGGPDPFVSSGVSYLSTPKDGGITAEGASQLTYKLEVLSSSSAPVAVNLLSTLTRSAGGIASLTISGGLVNGEDGFSITDQIVGTDLVNETLLLEPDVIYTVAIDASSSVACSLLSDPGGSCPGDAESASVDPLFTVPAADTLVLSSNLAPPTVPEPSTWAMIILGFAGLGAIGFDRRRGARGREGQRPVPLRLGSATIIKN
jgi:hypothetical protein